MSPIAKEIRLRSVALFLALVVFLLLLLPQGHWVYPRAISIVDGAAALVIFTVAALLLLSQKLHGKTESILAYGFLAAAFLRFFSSSIEEMDDVIWLHRLTVVTLAITLIVDSLIEDTTSRERRQKLSAALAAGLALVLALGLAIAILPPFLHPAFKVREFSVPAKLITLTCAMLFFYGAYRRRASLKGEGLLDPKGKFPIFAASIFFGVATLLPTFCTLWSAQWWLVQITELGATILLLISLFVTDVRSRERLRSSNEDLDRFASVAAHDLKEPLRMISMYMQLLRRENADKLDDKSLEYLWFAQDGARRLSTLIDELFLYARLEAQLKRFETVDLNLVVEKTLRNLDRLISETGARIRCEKLPSVEGDPITLVQLLQNLLANAMKYRRKEMAPEIAISAQMRRGNWVVAVRDNGIGFSMDSAETIFEPFRRLHGRSEYPGSGLGLATCRKIVAQHGGKIWAESAPDKGSTFYFSLPDFPQSHVKLADSLAGPRREGADAR